MCQIFNVEVEIVHKSLKKPKLRTLIKKQSKGCNKIHKLHEWKIPALWDKSLFFENSFLYLPFWYYKSTILNQMIYHFAAAKFQLKRHFEKELLFFETNVKHVTVLPY